MKHIKNLILDMDGVLWRGEMPMPGLADFFKTLRTHDIQFVLATNNAAKTPQQYVKKLAKFGVPVSEDQIFTSAEATGDYLQHTYEPGVNVFVVGDVGLVTAVQTRGFRILSVEEVMGGETAVFVVAGFHPNATYPQMAAGALLIYKGADFIGSNPDLTFPSEYGPLPGAGSFLAFLQAGSGVEPTVIGKPGPLIFQMAMQKLGGTPQNTAMVGDRLETDIAGGQAAGIQTILVLSGITQRNDLNKISSHKPDFIFRDISEIRSIFTTLASFPKQRIRNTFDENSI
ncbi:HAD-IIA family hydrolase [Candidatus Leptofilum sp.]|uniref:HAD-IIA family hydrolase n=1 Tax=Candidatus Leptofilum sp. TaxID=3241576 RepID=UPI003B591C06